MDGGSRTLEIIRRIGEAAPPPVQLSKLLVNPGQVFFSFAVNETDWGAGVRALVLLGRAGGNIRFVSEQMDGNGVLRWSLTLDQAKGEEVLRIFEQPELAKSLADFAWHRSVAVLSLYPFNGDPGVAGHLYHFFRLSGIDTLATTASPSVISCVIDSRDMEAAVDKLNYYFGLP